MTSKLFERVVVLGSLLIFSGSMDSRMKYMVAAFNDAKPPENSSPLKLGTPWSCSEYGVDSENVRPDNKYSITFLPPENNKKSNGNSSRVQVMGHPTLKQVYFTREGLEGNSTEGGIEFVHWIRIGEKKEIMFEKAFDPNQTALPADMKSNINEAVTDRSFGSVTYTSCQESPVTSPSKVAAVPPQDSLKANPEKIVVAQVQAPEPPQDPQVPSNPTGDCGTTGNYSDRIVACHNHTEQSDSGAKITLVTRILGKEIWVDEQGTIWGVKRSNRTIQEDAAKMCEIVTAYEGFLADLKWSLPSAEQYGRIAASDNGGNGLYKLLNMTSDFFWTSTQTRNNNTSWRIFNGHFGYLSDTKESAPNSFQCVASAPQG